MTSRLTPEETVVETLKQHDPWEIMSALIAKDLQIFEEHQLLVMGKGATTASYGSTYDSVWKWADNTTTITAPNDTFITGKGTTIQGRPFDSPIRPKSMLGTLPWRVIWRMGLEQFSFDARNMRGVLNCMIDIHGVRADTIEVTSHITSRMVRYQLYQKQFSMAQNMDCYEYRPDTAEHYTDELQLPILVVFDTYK